MAKEVKPKAKAAVKKPATKKLAGIKVVVNTDTTIQRQGYRLVFLKPKDQKGMNELINTGKVFDTVASTWNTSGDKIDELIYFVKD